MQQQASHPICLGLGTSTSPELGPRRDVVVEIPDSGQVLTISMPADFDSFLDRAEGDPEQNLPYWAELWPSGIALAAFIVRHPEFLRRTRVIELGCGLGVTAIAALRAGAQVLVTDYATEALALCTANCLANASAAPDVLQMNWRSPGPEFFAHVGAGVPLLLAADVLYEERDIEPLLTLVDETLVANGELWLAHPGRRPALKFMVRIAELGWQTADTIYEGPWPDPEDNRKGVVVTVHRIARSAFERSE